MRHRQRHARKGRVLKIYLGRSWHPGHSVSSSHTTISLPLRHWCLPQGKMETSSCWPNGQHQSASRQYMDKFHIFQPAHLHQAVPAQVWMHTIVPPWQFRESCLGHLSSSHRLEHRALLHRRCPLIKTQPMTTPRLGEVPVRTLLMRVTLSSWWPRSEHLHITATVDIPPSGDQKRPMAGHSVMEWSEI
jgi:hypothetical protein